MNGQRRGVQPGNDFTGDDSGAEIDYADGAFVGDKSGRIHLYFRSAAGGASQIARVRPSAAPVTHVRFIGDESDIVRRHPNIEHAQQLAGPGIKFAQPIRQIQRDIKPPAIARDRQAGWNVIGPTRRIRAWHAD